MTSACLIVCLKKLACAFSSIRFFVTKRYIPQQKCLKGQMGTCLLRTRWCNFWPCTLTLRATMHSVTDRRTERRTDGRQDDANSRPYCVAVRSAKSTCRYFDERLMNVCEYIRTWIVI